MKIKALITLVVGQGKEIAPNSICDVNEDEAKRLISLGFAESIKNTQSKPKVNDNDKPDDKGGEQPIPENGDKG